MRIHRTARGRFSRVIVALVGVYAGLVLCAPALAAAATPPLLSTQTSETGSGTLGPGTTLGVTFNEAPVLAGSYSLTLTDGTRTAQLTSGAGGLSAKLSGQTVTFAVGSAPAAALSRTNLEVLAATGITDAAGDPWNLIGSGQADNAYVLSSGDAVHVSYSTPVTISSPFSLTLSEGTSTAVIGSGQGNVASVSGSGTNSLTFTLGAAPQTASGGELPADGPSVTAQSGITAAGGGSAPAVTATTVTTVPSTGCTTVGYTRVFGGTNCAIGFGNPGPSTPDVFDVIPIPTADLPGPPDDSAPEVIGDCAAGSTLSAFDATNGTLLGTNACGNNPPEQLIGNTNSATLDYVPTPHLTVFEQAGVVETVPGSAYVSATTIPPQLSSVSVSGNTATFGYYDLVTCENSNADSGTISQFSYAAPASNLSRTALVYPRSILCPPTVGAKTITVTYAAPIPVTAPGGVRFKYTGYGAGHFVIGAPGTSTAYEREVSESATVAAAPVATGIGPPVDQGPPTITGDLRPAHALTEHHGAWSANPTGYAYIWQRCSAAGSSCVAIAGASGQTHTVTRGDVSHRLRVLEVASNAAGAGAPAPSAVTGVVRAAAGPVARGARPKAHIVSARIDSRRRTAVFRLRAAGRARGFQCSLVRRSGRAGSGFPHSRYRRCPATVIYRHLRTGTYRFSARAFGPGGIQRIPLIVVFNVVAGHPGTPAKGRR